MPNKGKLKMGPRLIKYGLTCVTVRFVSEGFMAKRVFYAATDKIAIHQAEHPEIPLKIIVPGEGAINTVPRELVNLSTDPPRVVKRW